MAERALIPFADELEYARTLRDVVVRVRQATRCAVQRAADSQKLAPCAWHGSRVDASANLAKPRFCFIVAIAREQRFGRDEIRLDCFGRRRGRGDFVR
jgi:hypothetical protein